MNEIVMPVFEVETGGSNLVLQSTLAVAAKDIEENRAGHPQLIPSKEALTISFTLFIQKALFDRPGQR